MAYIPSHQSLREHPKLKRFARQLGIKEAHAIGHLHCFWWWALDYAPGGSLQNHDAIDIAIGSEWDGDADLYVQALVDCRFIERSDDNACTYRIHDWDEYGGQYQEKLIKDRDRKRKERELRRNSNAGPDVSNGRPVEIPRTARQGEKRRGEDINPLTPKGTSRGTRLPDDFPITDEMRSWAQGEVPGVDIEHHHKQFCRYWWSETGRHATKANWFMTWQRWMAKEAETIARIPPKPNGMPPEIARLPWNSAKRIKWEYEQQQATA